MWTHPLRLTKHLLSCFLYVNQGCDSAWTASSIPGHRVYEDIQWCAGSVPWQPPHTTVTLQQWWNGRWTHWPLRGKWWKKGKSQHCLAWGMHIVYLCSSVFHHHSISIWLAYIPACVLSHIWPLWEFNFAVIMMVRSPHLTYHTTPSMPWLLLSP